MAQHKCGLAGLILLVRGLQGQQIFRILFAVILYHNERQVNVLIREREREGTDVLKP
jgi:hypothetical protein